MAELDTLALPVLPLTAGVVLPQTVVTLTLDSDEAKAAVAAADGADGRVLLVPRIDGRYARVGTVAHVEEAGELPNGVYAAILRGLHRARLGAGVAGTGSGLWVEAHEVVDPAPTTRVDELGRELRGVLTVLGERRRSRRLPELLRSTTDPAGLADGFGAWSDLPSERKLELLEATDPQARVELALDTRARPARGARAPGAHPPRGHRRHGGPAAGVPAPPAAAGDSQGARRRGRRGRRRRVPRAGRGGEAAGGRAHRDRP